jgi:hypothetical protein
MGASDPPGTTYIPGLRENQYGLFTMNLGVYVPEVARFHLAGEPKGFIREYNCCVRARLGDFGPEGRDLWWPISENRELMDEIETRIARDALPFFERYCTRDSIVAAGKVEGANFGAGGPPRVIAAIILACRGEVDAARALLARQVQERQNPGHPAYVRALAERLGIADLEAERRTSHD